MVELVIDGYDISKVITENIFYFILFLIIVDIVTGLLKGAKERRLNSSISFEGMIKKIGEMIGLVFLTIIDTYLQANGMIIKIGVGLVIAYEGISIIENLGSIGVDFGRFKKFFDPDKIGRNK